MAPFQIGMRVCTRRPIERCALVVQARRPESRGNSGDLATTTIPSIRPRPTTRRDRQATSASYRDDLKEQATDNSQNEALEGLLPVGDPRPTESRDPQATSASKEQATDNSQNRALLGLLPVGALALLVGVGIQYKDPIRMNLEIFADTLHSMGPQGYILFIVVYTLLELLAIPAIPLTLSAGALFGLGPGTLAASIGATTAATGSFLIARYFLREKVQGWAAENPKLVAIDKAISKEGFKIVTLLRLSPLLPLSASNYLYGVTSVELKPYILGSWLGMLPGTFLYVQSGAVGMALVDGATSGGVNTDSILPVIAALGFTVITGGYITKIANEAVSELSEDTNDKPEPDNFAK